MKYQTLSLALAALLALTPAYAQSSRRTTRGGAAAAATTQEAAAPKSGVRFVMCAPAGGSLPNPLFYKAGKDTYKKVTISGRIPTERIKPENGKIQFFKEDPTPQADAKGNKPKAEAKEQPQPVMEIIVPGDAGSKSVCIVVPGETPAKAQTFFLNEESFPAKGVHLINLASVPLKVYTSKTNDLTKAKGENVGPFYKKSGVTPSNSWHYTQGEHGDQVSFRITYSKEKKDAKTGKTVRTEIPIRMGKFVVSDRQGQVNIVVKEAKRDAMKLMSIQMAKD